MSFTAAQKQELEESKSEYFQTRRATVPEIDEILYEPFKVLDHGFVRVIDYMGSDQAVVQAARVSYGQGTKKLRQDQGLINYLIRHRHTTPFEMCEIKFHVKLPIFIARQWIRHRTANVNEYSARYSIMNKEFYIPNPENLCTQSESNRQGRDEVLTGEEAERVMQLLKDDSEKCYQHYEEMLNKDEHGNVLDENKKGLARELARMNLSLNYYTEWYWKIDLHNLIHFLALRADSHAQYEIQEYAKTMLSMVEKWVPITYKAIMDFRMNSFNCSEKMIAALKRKLAGEEVNQENSGLSKREWSEMAEKFGL